MHTIYPWQQKNWKYLAARKKNNDLPHALLLVGADGLGKNLFARCFAESLLCKEDNQPCGTCHSCRLLQADTHPDLYIIAPEKTGVIKIETIREVIGKVNLSSHQGGWKVVIIESADKMNIAASNALLKTLEEPAQQVLFILTSAKENLIPVTIRSRCQQIKFSPPAKKFTREWLQSKVDGQNLDLLLKFAHNIPLRALELVESNNITWFTELNNDLAKVMHQELNPSQFAKKYHTEDVEQILNYWQEYIIDLCVQCHPCEGGDPEINALLKFYELLIARKKVFALNLNKQLLLEELAIIARGISKC